MLVAYNNCTRADNEWHVLRIDEENGNEVTCLFVFNAKASYTMQDVLENWERIKAEAEDHGITQ